MTDQDRGTGLAKTRPATFASAVVLAALCLRLLAFWAAFDARPVQDEETYFLRAQTFLETGEFMGSYQGWARHENVVYDSIPKYPGAYQPPGYTVFIAFFLWLGEGRVMAVKLAQVLLGALSAALVYLIGRTWLSERAARWAAVLFALYPNLIAFTHCVWTETLFIFLQLLGFGLLLTRRRTPGRWRFVAAGVFLAAAVLTRSITLFFLPLFAGWFLWVHWTDRRTAGRRLALCFGVVAVLLLPWVVRNTRLHGGFVLIETNGAFNAWRGNSAGAFSERPEPQGQSYLPPFEGIPMMPVADQTAAKLVEEARVMYGVEAPTDLQVVACARRLALREIVGDPGLFLRRAVYKFVDLWNPTSFLLRHFRFGAYGPVHPAVEWILTWLSVGTYGLVMALAVLGLLRLRSNPLTGFVLLQVTYYTSIHLITFGLTRYRLPLMPWILLFAGQALAILLARRLPAERASAVVAPVPHSEKALGIETLR